MTNTQKQIHLIVNILCLIIIALGVIIIVFGIWNLEQSRYIKEQLSHKADRICVNETILYTFNYTSNTWEYLSTMETFYQKIGVSNPICFFGVDNLPHCDKFETKEVCTTK